MNKKTQHHNSITIKTYENVLDKYIQTRHWEITEKSKPRREKMLSYIKKNAKILEIGTWSWRDANYIENLWYSVQRSDATNAFIEYNKKQWKNIIKLDILNLDIQEKYDLVFANAVLMHFREDEIEKIFSDIHNILNNEWIFTFNVQKGYWEEFKDHKEWWPRFYKYRQQNEIEKAISISGFKILDIWLSDDNRWIQIISQKI